MAALQVLLYDVFTSRRFEGNQLAVFPGARGVDSRLMQTLAREMNFSESTCITPAEQPGTVSLQGVAMGRPSRLHIAITASHRPAITRVQVGGQAVLVGEGTICT